MSIMAAPQDQTMGKGQAQLDEVLKRLSFSEVPYAGEIRESDVLSNKPLPQRSRKGFKGLAFSPTSYTCYDGTLHERDRQSFCAAGFFLWRRVGKEAEVLMAGLEDRNGKRLLNFLGGRRDSVEESPCTVAARETIEETGGLLSHATREILKTSMGKTVIWIPNSKYALFIHELTEEADQDIHDRFALLRKGPKGGPLVEAPGIVALAWVRGSDLHRNLSRNFAPFTRNMISTLKHSGILADLWAGSKLAQ